MCVSIVNANGAKRYINEWLSGGGTIRYAKELLYSWQRSQGWLLDHEIAALPDGRSRCQKKFVATGNPGVAAVEHAIDEVVKTTPTDAPKKAKTKKASV